MFSLSIALDPLFKFFPYIFALSLRALPLFHISCQWGKPWQETVGSVSKHTNLLFFSVASKCSAELDFSLIK